MKFYFIIGSVLKIKIFLIKLKKTIDRINKNIYNKIRAEDSTN